MPLAAGPLTARFFRVVDPLPADFKTRCERNLVRHAFRPINVERGETRSAGWVDPRQLLDVDLRLDKVLMRDWLTLGLREDRIAPNRRLLRAMVAQATAEQLRKLKRERLTREEQMVIEDKVRQELLRRTMPSTTLYEAAWHLPTGLVIFSSAGRRAGDLFADLFAETFQVALRAQWPLLRAQDWAEPRGLGGALADLTPAPLSPRAPTEALAATIDTEDA